LSEPAGVARPPASKTLPRRPFPDDWTLDLQQLIPGEVILLRRTDDKGHARLFGHTFSIARNGPRRLVRAEVDLASATIRFFASRRREPTYQPLLAEIEHHVPRRRFHE